MAEQPSRKASRTEPVKAWLGSASSTVRSWVVDLEDQRNLAGKFPGAGLEEAKGRRIGVATRFDRQFEMVERVIGGRVRREGAGRPMFETLVDWENDEFARSRQTPMVHDPSQIGQDTRVFRPIPGQDFVDT